MSVKLNQIIAVTSGKKASTQKALTEIYHNLQKPTLFEGISRTYQPLEEDGETCPSEKKQVQYTTKRALKEAEAALIPLFDVTATQDYTNCVAKADVVVDGKPLLSSVPVTYLLFLEKHLIDIQTVISKLPSLDPAESWSYDDKADCWASEQHKTNKSKKVFRNHVKAEATKEHPAQVETYTEDVKVGEWTAIKFSGSIPVKAQNDLLAKIAKLIDAVKFARENANNTEVIDTKVGKQIFDYILEGAR